MRTRTITITMLAALALLGCEAEQPLRTKYETKSYTLLKKNPPKHFYVDLKDNETGEMLTHVYVSKHCNSHRETAVEGKVVSLTRVTRIYKDGREYTNFSNIREAFCR